ncbi:MAG: helix-turn-helix domain-containing protein [Candidatus Nanoarchaeia archaeon]|nr:helix-turn-helix domain-containing protein [Candidatus Nanoarchaeia archaeon]
MKDVLERLKEADLTGNEAKVYYELLKKGELVANQLAKNLSLDRNLTYSVLNKLIDKGQVSYIIKNNKKYFSITKSENLLNSLKTKELLVKELIEDLNKIHIVEESEQEIVVLEGKDGLRTLLNLVIKEKEFCAFASTGWAYYQLYEMPRVAKEFITKKVNVRLIGHTKLKKTEAFKLPNAKYRYVDVESKSPTSIFGDYVSIHLTTREKPLIILIKNKDIAETYRNYFEFMWKFAKEK